MAQRDMSALTMMSKTKWDDQELSFYHHALQQMTPYLNGEGVSLRNEIAKEIERRG